MTLKICTPFEKNFILDSPREIIWNEYKDVCPETFFALFVAGKNQKLPNVSK